MAGHHVWTVGRILGTLPSLALFFWAGCAVLAATPPAPAAPGLLKVHPTNPRYFADPSGRAVYLTGSHTWATLVDMGDADPPAAFDFERFLDFMTAHGHNCLRMWTWEPTVWGQHVDPKRGQTRRFGGPAPYARTGPGMAPDGKPKYDLTQFNPEYFRRLRERVDAAGRRGIYVSVILFEGYGIQFSKNAWPSHPYHAPNNVQGVEADKDGDGLGVEVHELVNPAVTTLQEAYVRKVIDTVNGFDHVLYEISNENHPASTEWQYHMIRFIQAYETTKPKQHPVGMTFQYKGGSNQTLFDSPADWISPNNKADGGYDYKKNPPPADGKKVILSDTDHLWGVGGDAAWVWKTFLRGHNPIFMDPYGRTLEGRSADEAWDPPRRAMGQTLRYARRMNLAAMRPRGNLASTKYCLANPVKTGSEYLVYLPDGGMVTVDLSAAHGRLAVEWFDCATGKTSSDETVDGGAKRDFTAPFAGATVLYLRATTDR